MRNRYFIYAYPDMYDGLHGMWDFEITEDVSYEGACEDGKELALQVIETYMRPEEELYTREDFIEESYYDEWDDSYEDEYYEALDEIIFDEAAFEVWHIRDDVPDDIIRQWEKHPDDPKEFIKEYCEHVE